MVVEKSTVPVKTAETIRKVLLAASSREGDSSDAGAVWCVLSSPEFLAEGTAISDLVSPARVLVGGDDTPSGRAGVRILAALYTAWIPVERILTTSTWSSELSKLAANAFLAQRISSINAMSALCEASGADVDEVAKAVGSDPRVGPHFLKASVGFGGSCFKKDILNLVWLFRSYGLDSQADYWEGVIKINDLQTRRFTDSIVARLFGSVSGKRIAILGYAFKAGTGDARESPATAVAQQLLAERAFVAVFDPKVTTATIANELASAGVSVAEAAVEVSSDAYAAAKGAHAIVIATDWPEFANLDWRSIFDACAKPAFVFDGRNILDLAALRHIGFECVGIGKPAAKLQAYTAAHEAVRAAATPPSSPRASSTKGVKESFETALAALSAAAPGIPQPPRS